MKLIELIFLSPCLMLLLIDHL